MTSTARLVFRFVLVSAAASAAALPLQAQTLLAELKQPGIFGGVGQAVGSLGDVSGDGVPDLIAAGNVGAFVKSGADGSTLAFASFGANGETPIAVDAAGDLDGDGTADFVAATAVYLRAHSGADGSELWKVPAGTGSNYKAAVEAVGDVNGDGTPDVAVAEAQVPSTPQLRVLSGVDGTVLFHLFGLGFAMDSVEWDGTPGLELVVGEPDFSQAGDVTGRLRVIEPIGGATLATFVGGSNQHMGFSVAAPGDLDGDGVPDFIASSQFITGATTAWSGADGSVVWSLPGAFFFNLEPVGDCNGDGVPDVVGGGPGGGVGGTGSAHLRNGATGANIVSINSDEQNAFRTLEGPGDVTGDGVPDLFSGSAGAVFVNVPAARVHALPSGALALTISNPLGGSQLGGALDVGGDFDGDGKPDGVLGSRTGVTVFSLDDGALLLDIVAPVPLPSSANFDVAAPGDLNGDGHPDVLLGNSGANFSLGRVSAFSGVDAAALDAVNGSGTNCQLGHALAVTADRDGDGVLDVYASAVGLTVSGVANVGEVRLLSGATLDTLDTLQGDLVTGNFFGLSLDAGGDADGDGVPDVLVGSSRGILYIMSGASGDEIDRITTLPGQSQPRMLGSWTGDTDGDGVEDILAREPLFIAAGPPSSQPGRVRLFSGKTRELLYEKLGTVNGSNLGAFAAGVGDVNGDGFADFAFTERSADPPLTSGAVRVISGANHGLLDLYLLPPSGPSPSAGDLASAGYVDEGGCSDVLAGIATLGNNGGAQVFASSDGGIHGFVDLGFGKPGTGGKTPRLNGYGDLAPDGLVTIKVRDAKPLAPGVWFIGLSQGNVPFKQGTLVPLPGPLFFVISLPADAAGQVTITANNPSGVFAGLSLYHQFWFSDPAATANLSASNGLREIFK
jgi:hypothetical protein